MKTETDKNKYEAIYRVSERLNWVFVIPGGRSSTRLVGAGEKLESHFSHTHISPNSGEKLGKTTTGLLGREVHQAHKMMSLQREPRTCCDISF